MEKILITGGTGLTGSALASYLINAGFQVIILSRKLPAAHKMIPHCEYALWDPARGEIDTSAVHQADHIILLAGAGVVDKRWTAAYKRDIAESRIAGSKLVVATLSKQVNKVKTIVSASAIGWYGPDSKVAPDVNGFTELAAPSKDFLGETCRLWEQSIEAASALKIRVVKLRTGIVLSNSGGAMLEFLKPLKFGFAAILGSGHQKISWIHIDDLCALYLEAIRNLQMDGSYNAVAPAPVTNQELTLELANQVRGKFYIPIHIPAFFLRMVMGESSVEVLKSCTVSAKKIMATGFTFRYPSIQSAISQLCKK